MISSTPHFDTHTHALSNLILFHHRKLRTHPALQCKQSTLNLFASQPLSSRRAVRHHIQQLFTSKSHSEVSLEGDEEVLKRALFEKGDVVMHMPVMVGDYTDFCRSNAIPPSLTFAC